DRHRKEGTVSSSTRLKRAGTPALRKYFCASTSEATWLQNAGTSTFSALNTTEPSGLRISDVVSRNSISAYADCPSLVKRRSIRILLPLSGADRLVRITHQM